jgi:hypothetical protein
MKKLMISCLLLICTGIISATKYIWLHGLEGEKGANTWDIYKSCLSQGNGYVFEYASNNSIKGIASNVYNNQIKPVLGSDKIILVGHSMGGLVARSIQQLCPEVNGIITAGTAHSGSTAVKNILTGKTVDYISNTIKIAGNAIDGSLWSGIFCGFPVTTLAAPLILPVSAFKDGVVNSTLTTMKLVSVIGSNIYALSHQCIYDMLPNSNYMNEINSKVMNVPLVNIYGAEDNWQVIRALGSLARVSDVKNPANLDKSYDLEYVTKIKSGMAYVNQIQNVHNLVYSALAAPAVFLPWIWLTRELVLKARFEWDALYWYLENGLHADLASNLGAYEYRLQSYCLPTGYDLKQLSCTSKYLPYVLENDGILAKKDALAGPQLSSVGVYNVRVPGVNHQEMGNHIEMRKTFENIIRYKYYGENFAK